MQNNLTNTEMNPMKDEDVIFVMSVGRLIREDPADYTETIRQQITDVIWKFEGAETRRAKQQELENANQSRTGLLIPTVNETVVVVQTNQTEVDGPVSRSLEDREPIERNQQDDILSCGGTSNTTHPEEIEQQPLTLSTALEVLPGSISGRPFRHPDKRMNQIPRTRKCGHECPQCLNVLSSKTGLKRHLLIHLDQEERDKVRGSWKLQCRFDFCLKKFLSNYDLQQHGFIHLAKKNFKCTKCEKRFQTPRYMKEHLKNTHNGDHPVQCYFCEKKFPFNSYLFRHLKIHTREMSFKCGICSREFRYQSNLNRHVASVHEQTYRYSCGPRAPSHVQLIVSRGRWNALI